MAVIFATIQATFSSSTVAKIAPISILPGTNQIWSASVNDLAIQGQGFFILRDADDRIFYTRRGDFALDPDGYLVGANGFHVQGLTGDLTAVGDLRIGDPRAETRWITYEFHSDGTILVTKSDGSQSAAGQILLQNLDSPEGGLKFPYQLILRSDDVGAFDAPQTPGSAGVGLILSGQLETPTPEIKIRGKLGQFSRFDSPFYSTQHVNTDLAIRGRGFFVLRDPATGGLYATRAGAFLWDAEGYLVNYARLRVQGRTADGMIDDIRVVSAATNEILAIGIDWWGSITAFLQNGDRIRSGRILLRDCIHRDALVKGPFAAYEINDISGEWSDYTVPNESGLGQIFAYALDLSQVDPDILAARARMNFFVRGDIEATDNPVDCYVTDRGMFIVRDAESNIFYATRNGAFRFDQSGALVTANGFHVQGENVSTGRGDIVVPELSDSARAFRMNSNGEIVVERLDGLEIASATILLQDFKDRHSLVREPDGLYSNIENALPKFPNGGAVPGTGLLGYICSGFAEIETDTDIHMPSPDSTELVLSNCDEGWIEASDDLRTWERIGDVFGPDIDGISFIDSNSAGPSTKRFYRVVVPPPYEFALPLTLPLNR